MIQALEAGESILDVDRRFNYEKMLQVSTTDGKS